MSLHSQHSGGHHRTPRATHIKWGVQGIKTPKEHTSEAEFGVFPITPSPGLRGVRETHASERRGWAPQGMDTLAPVVTKGEAPKRITYAPMTKWDLRKPRSPEAKADLYLSGDLKSFQIPTQVWPAVRLYRQLALQAEMLNEVPPVIETQMNELYDAVLAWCEGRASN